jgi:tRNA 2-thiouridine synthesizing protein E
MEAWMDNSGAVQLEGKLDNEGFLLDLANWTRETADELAARNDIGPLSDEHWKIIEFVRMYYLETGQAPPIVKIGKATGLAERDICKLFPCGVICGVYRLAGLPRPLWKQLRTTNVIERCFVEVRRRTRPMVCSVNVESVDRIIYAISNGFNEQWRDRTLCLFTQTA